MGSEMCIRDSCVDRSYKANCNLNDLNKLYAVSVCLSLCLSGYRYRMAFVLIVVVVVVVLFLWGGGSRST